MSARPRLRRLLLDEVDHRHVCRTRELEILMQRCGEFFREPILEIGSGDGYQARILTARFGRLIATDVETSRFRAPLPIVAASSERLPFRDGSFHTVFSSSVLEHVVDLDRGLAELTRVLAPGGYMVHVLPTRVWQSLMLGLRLPYMLARRLYRFVARSRGEYSENALSEWWYAGHDIRWDNVFDAPVHGVSRTHRGEWHAFSHGRWAHRFRQAGLRIVRTADLYTFSPYGLLGGIDSVRVGLARAGFPSVRAYVLTPARPCA
jgi:SAM-dependent methyltransferase